MNFGIESYEPLLYDKGRWGYELCLKGCELMTEKRRITFVIPDEMDQRILALRSHPEFSRLTYSELIRKVLSAGIELVDDKAGEAGGN